MSTTPAARLANLKVRFQSWLIAKDGEFAFRATRGTEVIHASSLDELETQLTERGVSDV